MVRNDKGDSKRLKNDSKTKTNNKSAMRKKIDQRHIETYKLYLIF